MTESLVILKVVLMTVLDNTLDGIVLVEIVTIPQSVLNNAMTE